MSRSSTRITCRVGVRAAAGVEVVLNPHLHLVGEIGYEYFFNAEAINNGMTTIDPRVPVPVIGIEGRL